MNLNIKYLPNDVNDWELTRIISKAILHNDDFLPRPDPDARKINFLVKVNPSLAGGVRNDGTGVLTLPNAGIGHKFLDWVKENPLKIRGNKIKFYRKWEPPWHSLVMTLQRTPFVDPDIEEAHANKVLQLDDKLRVDIAQFGVFFKSPRAGSVREYSVEWQHDYTKISTAWLKFEYDHKLIRIMLGNPMTEEIGYSIAINFASIQKIGVGYDPAAYVCFDTLTPPVFECEEFHRTLTGDERQDSRKYKHRVGSLNPGHARIAPYCQKLRLVLYDRGEHDVIDHFRRLCKIAELADSLIIQLPRTSNIIAGGHGLFDGRLLYNLRNNFKRFDWSVAFQLEALLYNCLLHTGEITELLPRIHKLCEEHTDGHFYVSSILRDYTRALRNRSSTENPFRCFEDVLSKFNPIEVKLSRGNFDCYHVTFAPTSMILEGPYPTQSNRVIRRYEGFEHHFIRVDFRDEDRLQYRWDRAVDGTSFLEERVGGILKSGFELGGRQFEFLAYSNSALREHAVWFISPFHHPIEGFVNGNTIRDSIGDFKDLNESDYTEEDKAFGFYEKDSKLLKQPSKFAARIAQAFTATDPSVKIRRDQWEMMRDLGEEPYLATDGVGTISESLADEIWDALCKDRSEWYRSQFVRPSAFQIRFLGFKGMVAVDRELDKHGGKIRMRLRPSMRKFSNRSAVEADIEIARAFERPNKSYLNRPLVTILEDRQVKKQAFLDLLDLAVAEVYTIEDSLEASSNFMQDHSLGTGFRVPWILKRLHQRGSYIGTKAPSKSGVNIDNPFLQQLREVGRMDILREIKHSARIPIPDSYLLVGVADEGPAYEEKGYEDVYTLPEGHIFACVQRPEDPEPIYLEGRCTISRSPVAHPGDIQTVHAIGKPPTGKLCLFAHMKNVVVLPSRDLLRDLYDVITYPELQPPLDNKPMSYEAGQTLTLQEDRTVEPRDICDFIVNYINSDVLGLLSDRLLVIADQSKDGIHDRDCEKLAKLCSQAVDYPKNGIPVDLDKEKLPSALIRCKPDWHAAEVVDPRGTDYYMSTRALGEMFRKVKLAEPTEIASTLSNPTNSSTWTAISGILSDTIVSCLGMMPQDQDQSDQIAQIFHRYRDELRYICATHTLSNTPGVTLLEAEVVMGTILAKCSQRRWRKDRIYRMRTHANTLVNEVKRAFSTGKDKSEDEVKEALKISWLAWEYALNRAVDPDEGKRFGANSFALVALDCMLGAVEDLEKPGLVKGKGEAVNGHSDMNDEVDVYMDMKGARRAANEGAKPKRKSGKPRANGTNNTFTVGGIHAGTRANGKSKSKR
uniref:RNA-dependent RNA polymerase n=1 Tax=Moniliophthora roreri TaxID=221103 RepID=A0A0W0FPC4_MONRR